MSCRRTVRIDKHVDSAVGFHRSFTASGNINVQLNVWFSELQSILFHYLPMMFMIPEDDEYCCGCGLYVVGADTSDASIASSSGPSSTDRYTAPNRLPVVPIGVLVFATCLSSSHVYVCVAHMRMFSNGPSTRLESGFVCCSRGAI